MVCPACEGKGDCVPHGSYRCSLIEGGKVAYSAVEVKRVRCTGFGHTHAILPDCVIPYTTYSLPFILRVLARHFLKVETVERLCRRYSIS